MTAACSNRPAAIRSAASFARTAGSCAAAVLPEASRAISRTPARWARRDTRQDSRGRPARGCWRRAGARGRAPATGLEAEPQAEPNRALAVRDEHPAEVLVVDGGARETGLVAGAVAVLERVRQVERLRPELEFPRAAELEAAEHRQVDAPLARTAERVASAVAEADALGLRERRRVEPGAVAADVAQLVVLADLIGGLLVARHVQHGAVGGHREGHAGVGGEDAVELPVAREEAADPLAVAPEGQLVDRAELEDVRPVVAGERPVPIQ